MSVPRTIARGTLAISGVINEICLSLTSRAAITRVNLRYRDARNVRREIPTAFTMNLLLLSRCRTRQKYKEGATWNVRTHIRMSRPSMLASVSDAFEHVLAIGPCANSIVHNFLTRPAKYLYPSGDFLTKRRSIRRVLYSPSQELSGSRAACTEFPHVRAIGRWR